MLVPKNVGSYFELIEIVGVHWTLSNIISREPAVIFIEFIEIVAVQHFVLWTICEFVEINLKDFINDSSFFELMAF